MLFLLNKTANDAVDLIKLLGGEEDKDLLLVQDAAFYAGGPILKQFAEAGVETVYAAKDAVEERAVQVGGAVEIVDYDRMVELIMEEHDKVVCI
jgi:sulfur relay protein TusB/DsrH